MIALQLEWEVAQMLYQMGWEFDKNGYFSVMYFVHCPL